jgi:hypothetical protein
MNTNDTDTFYLDPEKQERVPATYRVYLTAPASCDGFVEIEAASAEEAARLALTDKYFAEIGWDCSWETSEAEVVDVECEDRPAGAVLIGGNRNSTASLHSLFEPNDAHEQDQAKANDGGGQCN